MKNAFILFTGLLLAAGLLFPISGSTADSTFQTVQSLVSTSAAKNGWSMNYPKQRKVFWMADLLWVFYSDGVDAVFRTSADGVKWSNPTPFGKGGHFGHRFAGCFDGTSFHYTLCTAALGAEVCYRCGKPNRDGTITWATNEQTAYKPPADKNIMYPKIIVDSTGCPWISFMQLVYQVPNTPPYDALVIKSSDTHGKWATASGFPFAVVSQKPVAGYPDPIGVPLTTGKTFWFYNTHVNGKDIFATRIWNGQSWEAEETAVASAPIYSYFNAVADGDDAHVVYGVGTIMYQKRTRGLGWSKPYTIATGASGHTSITRVGHDNVIVTWLNMSNNTVCYREKNGTTWVPSITWIDEKADGLAGRGINLNTLVGILCSLQKCRGVFDG